ncbi:unnamed protein product [uncultured bacterium]|nr:unnamed protein product [uncultured bacterium]
MFPSSDTMFPSSDTMFPSSDTMLPSSDTMFPSGDTMLPSSDTMFPSGDTMFPSGDTMFPSGDTMFPSGDTMFPSGDTMFPSGDTMFPSGDTMFPSGDTDSQHCNFHRLRDSKVVIRIVLASASPRRQALLREHGYEFSQHPVDVEEAVVDFLSVAELALLNAVRKSRAAARFHPSAVVVGADTLVSLNGHGMGKPSDLDEARRMLSALSGKVHQVYTGISLTCRSEARSEVAIEVTDVQFRELSAAEIDDYLQLINPLDKAGGYAAQEHGDRIIAKVEGSWTNVVGLPMKRFRQLLLRFLG